MTLEDAIVRYHLDLAGMEDDAIREQLAALGVAATEIERAVDQHAGDGDSLSDGWWLALIPLIGLVRSRLRVRVYEISVLRLVAIAVASVEALERALMASGDDQPLTSVPPDKLKAAALAGPNGRSWPDWYTRNADAMMHRIAGQFRTAHTREEVAALVERARKLAASAVTATTVTAMHSAANRARIVAAGDDARFSRWRYTAVMDSRTSEICRDLNGTEWRFNDPNAPYPPRHPNCRSIVVPLE